MADGRVDLYAGFCTVRRRCRCRPVAAIHLGLPLPTGSSDLPAGIGRAALERLRRPAPRGAGLVLALLRVGFT